METVKLLVKGTEMEFSESELDDLEDQINTAQQEFINIERRALILGLKKGLIDFKQSKTLMDFLKR